VTEDDITLLYETWKAFSDLAQKLSVPYFQSGGTLLGTVRNDPPGPLNWDDDLDVYMFEKDFQRFRKALDADPHATLEYQDVGERSHVQLRLRDHQNCQSSRPYILDIFRLFDTPGGRGYVDSWGQPWQNLSDLRSGHFWGTPVQYFQEVLETEYPGALTHVQKWNHHMDTKESPLALDEHPELRRPLSNAHVQARLDGRAPPATSCFSLQ